MDISLLFFSIGSFLIFLGSNLLVDNSKLIAKNLGVSPIVIGLTVIALGTSLPELVVSVLASLKDESDVVIGNVMGSNISNIALVLPLILFIKPITINHSLVSNNLYYLLLTSGLFIVLLISNFLNYLSGLLLLLLFIYFIKNQIEEIESNHQDSSLNSKNFKYSHLFYILIGIIMLGYGAELFISGAIGIATFFGIPLIVISLSVVALGTSLPELITSIVAIKKNEPSFVIGNIIGSNIINIVLVLGASVILNPINIYYSEILISILIFIIATLFFSFISFNRNVLSKLDGFILFIIYLIFIYFNFMY